MFQGDHCVGKVVEASCYPAIKCMALVGEVYGQCTKKKTDGYMQMQEVGLGDEETTLYEAPRKVTYTIEKHYG